MPHLFTCPHCHSKTRVDDRYSGQVGECFSCGAQIQIPDFAGSGSDIGTSKRPASVLIAAGVVLVMLICLVFAIVRFGGSSVTRLAEIRTRNASIKNLEAIAGALNAYAVDHGRYPPAVLRDAKGRALHSWRVLILPYLDEQETFDLFDLSKPWDDPINLEASYIIPDVYIHPADTSQTRSQSGYYLITGAQTLFPAGKPLGPDMIVDSPSQTILVIGGAPPITTGMGGWAEPVDLDYSKMRGVIGGTVGVEPGGWLDEGVTMATVDGRGHFLPSDLSPATFNSLVTPSGGEPLPDDTLD